jgi:3D (Asp-Asp-Asp) domain-containing protein
MNMTRKVYGVLVAGSLGVAVTAVSVSAHHSFAAAFDADKPVTVKGVIVQAKLANPHSWIYLDVTDANGNVTRWGFEAQTPTALIRSGVKPEVFKLGSEVTIRGVHARDLAKNEGAAREIMLADGRSYIIGPKGNEPDRDK